MNARDSKLGRLLCLELGNIREVLGRHGCIGLHSSIKIQEIKLISLLRDPAVLLRIISLTSRNKYIREISLADAVELLKNNNSMYEYIFAAIQEKEWLIS